MKLNRMQVVTLLEMTIDPSAEACWARQVAENVLDVLIDNGLMEAPKNA